MTTTTEEAPTAGRRAEITDELGGSMAKITQCSEGLRLDSEREQAQQGVSLANPQGPNYLGCIKARNVAIRAVSEHITFCLQCRRAEAEVAHA